MWVDVTTTRPLLFTWALLCHPRQLVSQKVSTSKCASSFSRTHAPVVWPKQRSVPTPSDAINGFVQPPAGVEQVLLLDGKVAFRG